MVTKCLIGDCHRLAKSRGLCECCYQLARLRVNSKLTTWHELVKLGLAFEAKHKGNSGPAMFDRALEEARSESINLELDAQNKVNVEADLARATEKQRNLRAASGLTPGDEGHRIELANGSTVTAELPYGEVVRGESANTITGPLTIKGVPLVFDPPPADGEPDLPPVTPAPAELAEGFDPMNPANAGVEWGEANLSEAPPAEETTLPWDKK